MRQRIVRNLPFYIAIVLVSIISNCKKPQRLTSMEYMEKNKVVPLSFTTPTCSPISSYVILKKNNSSFINFSYSTIDPNLIGNDYRSFELRPSFGGSYYCYFNFIYLRQNKSANYELMSRTTHQNNRGYNNVEVYGQMSGPSGPGMLDSDQGGYVNVEYLSGSNKFKITICEVPMSFKYNVSGIVENVKVSAQFISE